MDTELPRVVNGLPGLVWTALPDGHLELLNTRFRDYTGLGVDQSPDVAWQTAIHPDDLVRWLPRRRSMSESAEPWSLELRLRRSDGAFRWFLCSASPEIDASGQVVRWYGVNTDIEDRKRAEEALRRSESFLLQVQGVSHTGGWRYDVATDTVESSPEIQRVYGIQPGEDITKPPFWFERIHPDERPRVQALFEQCLRENADYQADYRIVLPDGTIRYQYATGHPILDSAGNLAEFIGASMDMTEQWRATNELQRASEELRELHTAISRATQSATVAELAASIAHEINQPLFGIITNAHMCVRRLDTDPPDLDRARVIASRIVRDGNRASDVVARLRALFRKKQFTLEPLDLNDATREVIALSLSDIRRHRVIVQSELDEALPNVIGDRIQLQQVILNLLRNSFDAMDDVHDRPRLLVLKTELESVEHVRLSVRDVGVGLDRVKLGKLFDAFYTTKGDGMGIGLSICRSIIEHHQGRIWAVPNEDVGATFAFSIPHGQTEALYNTFVPSCNEAPGMSEGSDATFRP